MSKLNGNERWKTKMLMSEHVDQFEEKQEDTVRKMITVEERTMVRDLILLPYIDTMVSRSLKEIELSSSILKRAFVIAGQAIQRRIMQDTYQLQKELKQRNIKVLPDEQEEFLVYHKILCRGYQERFGLTRDVMRTEISLRLTKYTAELGAALKDHQKL
ncbi:MULTISPECIES: hypothetical protein [Paenibacillus]|jgi:hypothetical protein|uniref:hypothetical protein n=1 Tax=Paenibacillus TaxID=44249 RepID=UPI0004F8E0F1|nr:MULTISPECIES: hypothetical protein [unclassified Paenibacillus]AIQ31853.1 hypothetical protein P40081_29735 [Paenibacillus sp. FSL P4-0081]OMF26412.1 hypothetical protein BK132_19425 [Paenibacillus sp. FSL H8-0259]